LAAELVDDAAARIGEGAGDLHGALVEAPGQNLRGALEGGGHLARLVLQGIGEAGPHVDDAALDVLACRREGEDEALGRGLELVGEVLVRAADGRPDPVGARHDRLALRHQLVEKRADADLVVGIGPLQGGDFAAHEGLELAGAGERTLDAIAHGGDLAAHRLRHGEHGVG
jgi:hypothetical protein